MGGPDAPEGRRVSDILLVEDNPDHREMILMALAGIATVMSAATVVVKIRFRVLVLI